MKRLKLLLIVIIFLSCNEANSVEPINELSEVQFDLQFGFEDKSVSIMVDTTIHFSVSSSSTVPLAGPQARFSIPLEEGEHRLIIFGSSLNNINETFLDTSIISIGQSPKYFIGIKMYVDNIKVEIQDSSFFYL